MNTIIDESMVHWCVLLNKNLDGLLRCHSTKESTDCVNLRIIASQYLSDIAIFNIDTAITHYLAGNRVDFTFQCFEILFI
jgi:hypothetical protein